VEERRSIEERRTAMVEDPAIDLTIDGSGVGGMLMAAFGRDVTADEERCAHCGTLSVLATARVYARGPGIVIRCPACTDVMVRIVETPSGLRIDISGLARG
jgi:hypothetical protein